MIGKKCNEWGMMSMINDSLYLKKNFFRVNSNKLELLIYSTTNPKPMVSSSKQELMTELQCQIPYFLNSIEVGLDF